MLWTCRTCISHSWSAKHSRHHPRSAGSSLKIVEANARAVLAATKPSIDAVPRSELLSRAAMFLPRMASANAGLDMAVGQPPAVTVECVEQEEPDVAVANDDSESASDADAPAEEQEPHVCMDIACGVLELENGAAAAAAEAAAANGTTVDEDMAPPPSRSPSGRHVRGRGDDDASQAAPQLASVPDVSCSDDDEKCMVEGATTSNAAAQPSSAAENGLSHEGTQHANESRVKSAAKGAHESGSPACDQEHGASQETKAYRTRRADAQTGPSNAAGASGGVAACGGPARSSQTPPPGKRRRLVEELLPK